MVRSDSADEDQIINEDGFDLMEEDEDITTESGALPVIITADWKGNIPQNSSSSSSFDRTSSTPSTPNMKNTLRSVLPPHTSTIGHAPLLTNRSISHPAPLSPATSVDPDRRLRRQIANCNERRRMQSINAGFMALRALLPRKFQEGEKLSKAAILQQTADMVHRLLDERKLGGNIDGIDAKKLKLDDDYDSKSNTINQLQLSLENERNARIALEKRIVQLQEMLQKATTTTTTRTRQSHQFNTPSPPSTVVKEMSPERKPSIDIDSTSPLSMLNLNGSPTSSESIATSRLTTPTLKMTLPLTGLDSSSVSTVIRPTPLTPISVDISSSSPLTVNQQQQQQHPLIFPSNTQTQSSILFANAVNTTSSMVSSGNSTPTIPSIQMMQPSAFVSTQSIAAHHSIQTILDAIRHLEGTQFLTSSSSSPPTSQTSLVR